MSKIADWIQTYTGRCVDPLNVDPEEVELADVAHALALKCRFGGHCREFYSVAEHCVRVSVLLQLTYRHDIRLLLLGLLHDASEAYLPDVVAPLKGRISVELRNEGQSTPFRSAELRAMDRILEGLGVDNLRACLRDRKMRDAVKHADLTMLATEARDLMGDCDGEWISLPAPHPVCIAPMSWREARSAFVSRWRELWPLLHVTNSGPGGWNEQYARTAYPDGWEDSTA